MKHLFRFFAKKISNSSWCISDSSEKHHLKKVLKLKTSDEIEVFDGDGNVDLGKIADGRSTEGDILVEVLSSKKFPKEETVIRVIMGALKPSDWEQVLLPLTEVGVDEVHTFLGEHTAKFRVDDKIHLKCQKILLTAVKQSKRPFIPKIYFYRNLEHLLKEVVVKDQNNFMLAPSGNLRLKDISLNKSHNSNIALGGESGLTKLESSLLKSSGFQQLSLGDSILRAKTAAIASCFYFKQIN